MCAAQNHAFRVRSVPERCLQSPFTLVPDGRNLDMAWFWWLLWFFVVVLWIVALVDIIRRRHSRTAGKTAAWAIAVLVFPIVGTIVYFLVNGAGGEGAPRDPDVMRTTGERY
jgi:hypothetical protein